MPNVLLDNKAKELVKKMQEKHQRGEDYQTEFTAFLKLEKSYVTKIVVGKLSNKRVPSDALADYVAKAESAIFKKILNYDPNKGTVRTYLGYVLRYESLDDKHVCSTDLRIARAINQLQRIEYRTYSAEEIHKYIKEHTTYHISLVRINSYLTKGYVSKEESLSNDDHYIEAENEEEFFKGFDSANKISEIERKIVYLKVDKRKSFADIGKEVNLSRSTVQQKYNHAIHVLRLEQKRTKN